MERHILDQWKGCIQEAEDEMLYETLSGFVPRPQRCCYSVSLLVPDSRRVSESSSSSLIFLLPSPLAMNAEANTRAAD